MSHVPVLNVCLSNSWGGLEMSAVKMTRLFHEAGHPSLGVCRPDSAIERTLHDLGLTHEALTPARYFAPRATLRLRRLIDERGVRAIFLHSLKDLWLVAPALWRRPHVKLFGFARMFVRNVDKKDFLHGRLYGRMDRLIALSHPQRDELLNCLPVKPEQVIVIPNGVDSTRFAPRPRRDDLRQSWGVTPEQTLFGLIGRFDVQKGSLEFVEAAARVLDHHPQARFVMVGENTRDEGDFDRLIRRRVEELGLANRVILTEFRRDVEAVMNALDVFVMPSYEENFGNVLLEGLSSGLPCIGTDSGGTPEILSGGAVGELCQPRSAIDLARAVIRLLDDPAHARALGARARAKVEAEYEMGKVFARVRALVEE